MQRCVRAEMPSTCCACLVVPNEDNIHNEVKQGTGQYMYYIKVVPSVYFALDGTKTVS